MTSKASVRHRKLPAEQVVWLVLGMALYMNRSIRTVRERMGLLPNDHDRLAPSAARKARYRLGAEPTEWLFRRVCEEWSPSSGVEPLGGKKLYGVDGTHVRVPDTDESFGTFGKPGERGGNSDAGYPQAYSAESLIELYHSRCEREIGFDEFKTDLLERQESLRSKKPEGVFQEI